MRKLTYFYALLLTALFLLPWSGAKANELTVYDGTNTKTDVPIKGSHMDTQGTHVQVIYPASSIEDLAGKSITALQFYSSSTSDVAWTNSIVQIKLMEVEDEEFELDVNTYKRYFIDAGSASVAFSGHIEVKDQVTIIELDAPFTYTGNGNLLYDLLVTTAGSWTTVSYYGINQSNYPALFTTTNGAATGNSSQFLPKTTFTYSAGSGPSCTKPGKESF